MNQQMLLDAMAMDEEIQKELKQINEEFSVTESDGLDDVEIAKALEKKFDLKEMVSQIPRSYKAREESFGKPIGKEIIDDLC